MKRSNGEGTIYKRNDGRWCAAFFDEEDKRHFVYGRTQAEVKKKLKTKMEDPNSGRKKNQEIQTLEEWTKYFLDTYKKNELKESTYAEYLSLHRKHIKESLIGKEKLEKLTSNQFQEFYNKKQEEGYNAKTIKHIYTLVNSALNKAVQLKMIKDNVNNCVILPKIQVYKTNILTAEEVKKLLTEAKHEKLYPIVIVAVHCGLRRGECMALKWQNIDFDAAEVHIEGSLCKVMKEIKIDGQMSYEYKILSPKTAKSKRTIPLLPAAIEALKIQKRRQDEEKNLYANIYDDQDLVFARYDGSCLNQRSFLNEYKCLLKKYGIREVRFHDLRHTFASLLLEAGESPKIIQELLGHSTITTTMDIYAHVTKKSKVNAIEKFSQLVEDVK